MPPIGTRRKKNKLPSFWKLRDKKYETIRKPPIQIQTLMDAHRSGVKLDKKIEAEEDMLYEASKASLPAEDIQLRESLSQPATPVYNYFAESPTREEIQLHELGNNILSQDEITVFDYFVPSPSEDTDTAIFPGLSQPGTPIPSPREDMDTAIFPGLSQPGTPISSPRGTPAGTPREEAPLVSASTRSQTIMGNSFFKNREIHIKIYISDEKAQHPAWNRLHEFLKSNTYQIEGADLLVQFKDLNANDFTKKSFINLVEADSFGLGNTFVTTAYEEADMVIFYGQYDIDTSGKIFNILAVCAMNFGTENSLAEIKMLATTLELQNQRGDEVTIAKIGARLAIFASYYIPFAMFIVTSDSGLLPNLSRVKDFFGIAGSLTKIVVLHAVDDVMTFYISLGYTLNHEILFSNGSRVGKPAAKSFLRSKRLSYLVMDKEARYTVTIARDGDIKSIRQHLLPTKESNAEILEMIRMTGFTGSLFNMEINEDHFIGVLKKYGYVNRDGSILHDVDFFYREVMTLEPVEKVSAVSFKLRPTTGLGRRSTKKVNKKKYKKLRRLSRRRK